jgi:hypothetical protein
VSARVCETLNMARTWNLPAFQCPFSAPSRPQLSVNTNSFTPAIPLQLDCSLGLDDCFSNFTLNSPCPMQSFRSKLEPIDILSDTEESSISTTPTLSDDHCDEESEDWSDQAECETKRYNRMSISDDTYRDLSPGRSPTRSERGQRSGRQPKHFTFSRLDCSLSQRNILGNISHRHRSKSRPCRKHSTSATKSVPFPKPSPIPTELLCVMIE